jgi:exosome complex component RRP4
MAEFHEETDFPDENNAEENRAEEEEDLFKEPVLDSEESSPPAEPAPESDREDAEEFQRSEEEESQRSEEEEPEEGGVREVVIPGQVLGVKGKDMLPGYGSIADQNGNIIALFVGFQHRHGKYVNVQPFKGRYIPHIGDKVIGKIVDKNVVIWKLDMNSPYVGILRPGDTSDESDRYRGRNDRGGAQGGNPQMRRRFDKGQKRDDTNQYNVGDIICAKVLRFDRTTEPALTTVGPDLGIIKEGYLSEIAVPKIPRLIGKNGSMIKLLNSLTSCKIFVAQNGIVWLKGKKPSDERVILRAIRKIEEEANTTGLTDRIKEFIEQEMQAAT